MRVGLAVLCVFAAAMPAFAGPEGPALGGRWQGTNYRMAALSPDCDKDGCKMTLDIAPCGKVWCGIEVAKDGSCGATALEIAIKEKYEDGAFSFTGKLSLAANTEPYVIEAYLQPAEKGDRQAGSEDQPMRLSMTGDTGGTFRAYRRSFPFHATLARAGDAICKGTQKPVS
mgnify:CR=1 FL=1